MNLSGLNKEQKEAVLYTDGPLLVLAGAGSGKTRVLTYKIAYLIEELGVYPSQILAITFTNKAAKEMQERIKGLIGNRANGIWMGTFHSICVRILRRYAPSIGFEKDFNIYDTTDQKTLVKECLKQLQLSDKDYPVKDLMFKISKAKDLLVEPKDYELHFGDSTTAEIYGLYESKMRKNNAMDFDNLILNTLRVLNTDEDALGFYRNNFKYVLVDEYQDTNKAQYQLVSLLTKGKGNVFVVGDNDQSIYGWRGADIRNITEFEEDFGGAKVVKLEQNYRSTKNILNAANTVIKNNVDRKEKNLWTAHEEGEKIKVFRGYDEHDEADYVISDISQKVRSNPETITYDDAAILYRTNAQSRAFEDRLRRRGIPYKIIGGMKFYDRKEVKDMMAYLKVIQNPLDEISILRVVNEPKRGLGSKTIEKLQIDARGRDKSLFSMIIEAADSKDYSTRVKNGLNDFLDSMKDFVSEKENMSAREILAGIMDKSGYMAMLRKDSSIESRSRIENLEELMTAVKEFDDFSDDKSLEAYLTSISLMSDLDKAEEEDGASVTLMTLHSSKGLEFPYVYLVGMEEGIFPTGRAFNSMDELQEERRLCYVGITRAEKELTLSCAGLRTLYGRTNGALPSRFLEELPIEIVEEVGIKVKSQREQREEKRGVDYLSKHRVRETKPEFNGSVSPGTKVKHKMFGEGTIITLSGDDGKMATIAFDSKGIKKLHLDYAPIKVVG